MFDRYTSSIDQIYAAASGDGDWAAALNSVADLCGMESCALVLLDPDLDLAEVTAPRADPNVAQAYSDHWWSKDPTVSFANHSPVGVFTSLAECGKNAFLGSEFHNDFWRYSGLGADRIATNLLVQGDARAALVLQANAKRDEVTEEAQRLFRLLQPHFVRAIDIQRRLTRLDLAQASSRMTATQGASHVLAVDRAGRPVSAGRDPQSTDPDAAFTSGLLTLNKGIVTLNDPIAADRLMGLIASCGRSGASLRGGTLSLADGDGTPVARIDVSPWTGHHGDDPRHADPHAPVALLVVHDLRKRQDQALTILQDRFGLTGAEARVALEIARGDGREAAAQRLGITLSTARTHLSRIYDKTGTRRQAQLVALVSSLI
ncbi:helix-turn-helix transcriptional regulator [Pseudooceanicola sp. MF1-13]|uniref:helix-turn-helix transcriptional regulator n=1 Tax=Pseudooceanicola sp. MF1-13 TaxID=3379095 RepID=UPI0038917971